MRFKTIQKFHRYLKNPKHFQTFAFVFAAFVAGYVAVAYAYLYKVAEDHYHLLAASHPYWVFALTPICFLVAWALVHFYAPESVGSGIPQILAAHELNYTKHTLRVDKLLSLKVIVTKIASSLVACLGGAVEGREGPTIHISASLFHFIGKITRNYIPKVDPQTWIVAGAAAGLAATFNTPLGGIIFAIEEISISFKRFRTALIISIIICGLVSQWIQGSYLYLGYPNVSNTSFSILPLALLIGVMSGLGGSLYGLALKRVVDYRSKFKAIPQLALLAIACGLAMALMAFLNPNASGSGAEIIDSLLFKGQTSHWDLPLLRIAGSLIFYASGAAGGIFAPSLAAGACLGSWVGTWFSIATPQLIILMGMAGFLTGVVRAPFTSFVLIIEMTNHHNAIFPIMLCTIIAEMSARLVQKDSFYEWAKHRYLPNFSHTPS